MSEDKLSNLSWFWVKISCASDSAEGFSAYKAALKTSGRTSWSSLLSVSFGNQDKRWTWSVLKVLTNFFKFVSSVESGVTKNFKLLTMLYKVSLTIAESLFENSFNNGITLE